MGQPVYALHRVDINSNHMGSELAHFILIRSEPCLPIQRFSLLFACYQTIPPCYFFPMRFS